MLRVILEQVQKKLVASVLFACLALLTTLCVDACPHAVNGGPARRLSRQAIYFAQQGLLAKAEQTFDEAVALDPCDEEIIVFKAQAIYGASRRYDKENKLYSKALKINPSNIDALALRGISFERMHDYQSALRDFNLAITLNPNDARLYSSRGRYSLRQHRFKESMGDFDTAISLNPANAFALDDRAYTSGCLGLNTQGLKDIDKAIALNPKVADFFETRGTLLAKLHRFDEAIKAYDRAESLGSTQVILNRAELKMEAHYYREALPDFQRCVAMYPETGTFYKAKCGQCLMMMRRWSEALVELNQAIDSDYPFIYKWRAEVLCHFSRYDEALADYSKALTFFESPVQQHDYERAVVLLERARTFEQLHNFSAAFADLVSGLNADSSNHEIYFEFLSLVQNYLASGSHAGLIALELFMPFLLHKLFKRRRVCRLF